MRGHFRYLRFKTFPMTPRTPQCEVFCPLLLSSEHSGVPEDSNSQLFQVLGFTPTLGQSGVATVLGQATGNTDSLNSPQPGLGGSHHLPPYTIFCVRPRDVHPNGFLSWDSSRSPETVPVWIPRTLGAHNS
jgi:hypothetical protein